MFQVSREFPSHFGPFEGHMEWWSGGAPIAPLFHYSRERASSEADKGEGDCEGDFETCPNVFIILKMFRLVWGFLILISQLGGR